MSGCKEDRRGKWLAVLFDMLWCNIRYGTMDSFEIPRYRVIIEFAKDVAFHNHDVVYGGLDIAVTADGLELIEVNFPPAYIGYQAFGEGALKYLKKIGK